MRYGQYFQDSGAMAQGNITVLNVNVRKHYKNNSEKFIIIMSGGEYARL